MRDDAADELDDAEPPGKDHCSEDALRDRARLAIGRNRGQLPRLTKAHEEVIIGMMMAAYRAGESEAEGWEAMIASLKMQEISRKGVMARRRTSKRLAILQSFEAAAARNQEVSIEDLAREHGVSRATAYRAVNSRGKF